MPDGFEAFGPSLAELASYVQPLIFDSGIEGVDYGIAGSCFLASYRGQLFVITANHCIVASNGNDVRIALNPITKSFLPLKQLHRAQSNPPNQDWADVAIFEAAPELLSPEEQKDLRALHLDPLRAPEMQIKADAKLVVPSFPKCLNEVNYDKFVIKMQRYLPSGKYDGATAKPGIHWLGFDELTQINNPDGMSGSPVFFIEKHPEAHHFGFLGIIIKASQPLLCAEFISADVLFQMLDKIFQDQNHNPSPNA